MKSQNFKTKNQKLDALDRDDSDPMMRFDRVMRALVAVPKEEALKTMKKTIAAKKQRRQRKNA